MKKLSVYLSFLLMFFFTGNLFSQTFNHSEKELKEVLTFLASDDLKGRAAGTREDKKSAKFISERLSSYGFTPLISNNPLTPFNLSLYREVGYGSYVKIDSKNLVEWRDFKIHPQSPNDSNTTNLFFETDTVQNFEGSALIIKASTDSIPILAAKYKAIGVKALLVYTSEIISKERRGGTTALSIPVILISEDVYSSIKSKSGVVVSYKTVSNLVEGTTYNVVMKYGKDDSPLTVLIGAHYDHLGMGGASSGSMRPTDNEVHNGADDNASGVATALETGRLLSQLSDSLGLKIIVAAFGAEERGIVGSRVLADTLSKLGQLPNLMINLDMVGRMSDSKLQIGGVGTFGNADEIVAKANEKSDFDLTLTKDGYGPSDHASFYTAGVPVLYFTTGVHKQYHTPEDDVDFINFEGMGRIAVYISSVVSGVSASGVPAYIKTEAPQTMSRASFKVTLGVIPDFTYENGDGFRVGSVSAGKPAEKGGMVAGDIIKKMNNKTISNIYEYMTMLGELKKGNVLHVEIDRDGKIINLEIQL